MRSKVLSAIVLVFGSGLMGCVTVPSPKATELAVSQVDLVKKCQELGEFSGSSLVSVVDSRRGNYNSQVEAMNKAAEAGATHVVWAVKTGTLKGLASPVAHGYRCERYQLPKFSYRPPSTVDWKYFESANGQQGFCRDLDKQSPPSTICFVASWAETSLVSNQFKNSDEFFAKLKQLKNLGADSGRMKSISSAFKREKFKSNECLNFSQKMEDLMMKQKTGIGFVMFGRGRSCLSANDPKVWVDVSVSARVREGVSYEFSAEELKLLEDVEIGTVK